MKNIQPIHPGKYNDPSRYLLVADNIYKDTIDTEQFCYRTAISFELEDGEDSQYPLEDVLDKYTLYVSEFFDADPESVSKIELAGTLEDLKAATAGLVGKRAYNQNYVAEDGKTYVKLIIE